jgi:quercetin dioxygenase-like cupin family protein
MTVRGAVTVVPLGGLVSARPLVVLALIAAGVAAGLAQTPPPQTPAGSMANFTGGVRSVPSTDVRAGRFQYDAGARSYWHAHEGVQLLMPETGKGRYQIQGQQIREMLTGQPVALPAAVPHWHGAAPDQGMTQLAVNIGGLKWMAEVTDDEYLGRK